VSDLTTQEQSHVRTALRYLRTRCGGWEPLAKALHFAPKTLTNVLQGQPAGVTLAFRLARLASVPVDDVIGGRFPPAGTCPYCGHRPPDGPTNGAAQ
jgi:hypothetical protein